MDEADRIKHAFEKSLENYFRGIEKDLDIKIDSFNRLKNTIGAGMEQGNITYNPDDNNPRQGILTYKIREKGKLVKKQKEITDENEADMLFALQLEADQNKKV